MRQASRERLELNLSRPFIKSELEEADVEMEPKSYFVKEVNASIRIQTIEMKSRLEVQKVRLSEVLGGRLEELVEVESKRQKIGEAEDKSKEKEVKEVEEKAEKKKSLEERLEIFVRAAISLQFERLGK